MKKDETAAASQPVGSQGDSPFPGLTYAGELDDFLELPSVITMNAQWTGYANGRVLALFGEIHSGRLTHLRFLPDVQTGQVIMVPTKDENAYGAVPVVYSPTENAAEFNLRLAVKRLKLTPQEGRVYQFPVLTRKSPSGEPFLAFDTKGASTRVTRKKSKAKANQGTTPAETGPVAGSSPGEPQSKQG